MRPDAVFNSVGATMDDPDPAIINPKAFSTHLGYDRLKSLAYRRSTGEHFDVSALAHTNSSAVRRSETTLFNVHRKTEADVFAGLAALLHLTSNRSHPHRPSALSSNLS
jgi:hypothetical protein